MDVVRKTEDFTVRGADIPIEVEFLKCKTCGTDFDTPEYDDPLVVAFREYRHRKGLVQPEQIRSFRKKYGLTQYELARLLGWGATTLSRYETGALQDDAHDRALQMIMKPGNLLDLVENHPEVLSADKRHSITAMIRSEAMVATDLLDLIESRLGSYDPDERCGFQRFNPAKFFNAVLFFCREEGIPRTKLNKLLWYLDFKHFKEFSVSVTGARYAHCPHGPAPDNFDLLFAYLLDGSKALSTENRSGCEFDWEVLVAVHEPDLAVFSHSELSTLVNINDRFKDHNAGQISEFSHQEVAFQTTVDGEIISYALADSLQI